MVTRTTRQAAHSCRAVRVTPFRGRPEMLPRAPAGWDRRLGPADYRGRPGPEDNSGRPGPAGPSGVPGPGAGTAGRSSQAQPGPMPLGQVQVGLHRVLDPGLLAQARVGPDRRGHPDGQGACRDGHVLKNQRRRGDHGTGGDPGPVEDQGPRADQAAVFHHAPLQVRAVTDDAVRADQRGLLLGRVHDRAVLDRRPLPHLDQAVVPAQHRSRPHRRPGGQFHGADHHGVRVHERLRIDRGRGVVQRVDRHSITSPKCVCGARQCGHTSRSHCGIVPETRITWACRIGTGCHRRS